MLEEQLDKLDPQLARLAKICTVLKAQAEKLGYEVSLDPIDWSIRSNPGYGCSITVDDTSFLRAENSAFISIELGRKIEPWPTESVVGSSIKLMSDVKRMVIALSKARDGANELVLKIDQAQDRVVIWADATKHIQGIWATVGFTF